MTANNRKFLYAVAVLIGSMVGVGIFGLPYAFSRAGFATGMFFLVLIGLVTVLVDFMYGEVILRTHEKHQFFGYIRKYLGPSAGKLAFFSMILTGYVALLAYIIISSDFLSTLLSPFLYIPLQTYSIAFGIILSLVVLKGLKTVSWLELVFSSLFVVVIVLIFGTGVQGIVPANFAGFNRSFVFLPYGVLLFAFAGLVGVPIQREVLAGQEHRMKRAIVAAVAIAGTLYALFTLTVVGVSGGLTTPDAVSGLYQFLGGTITFLAALFGIFAITTSFMMLGSGLIETFQYDFKMSRIKSWLLVVTPPMTLYLAGIRSFVDIVSLAGGVAIGLEQILIVFLYAKAKSRGTRIPEYSLEIRAWLLYLLIAMFSTGIVYFLFIR